MSLQQRKKLMSSCSDTSRTHRVLTLSWTGEGLRVSVHLTSENGVWLFYPFAGLPLAFSPLALSPPGSFAPWLVRPLACLPPGWFASGSFAPWLNCSPPVSGWFAPWLVRSLAHSPPGLFALWPICPLCLAPPGLFVPGFFTPSPWTFRRCWIPVIWHQGLYVP